MMRSMVAEPDNLVLELLRQMRADISELKSGVHSLRADAAGDFLAMQAKNGAEHKITREQITGLRRAVVEYHSAVVGHGVLTD
jgi:hypothetical protein